MEELVSLRACPFCGTSAHMESRPDKARRNWKVVCSDEECMNYATVGWSNRESAVVAWNRRAGAPEHGVTQESRLAPASWLDALAKRLERRQSELVTARPNCDEERAVRRAMIVIYGELAEMLRAEMESASNGRSATA